MSFWTNEMDTLLKRLISERYSATRAAEVFTRTLGRPFTRTSVMGRAYRLGTGFNSVDHRNGWLFGGDKKNRVRKEPQLRRVKARPKPVVVRAPSNEPEPTGPLNDFPSGGCLWMHGDPKQEWRCCAAPRLENQSYCAHHYGRSYNFQARRAA